jgi:hypothetical protein
MGAVGSHAEKGIIMTASLAAPTGPRRVLPGEPSPFVRWESRHADVDRLRDRLRDGELDFSLFEMTDHR